MRYPRRSTFDRERDSGTSYGGRPRIGTYLLINLYRLLRAARTNRNSHEERREETAGPPIPEDNMGRVYK